MGQSTRAISCAERIFAAAAKSAAARADPMQISRHAAPGIEHAAHRPAKGADLDGIEPERSQFVSQIDGPGDRLAAVGAYAIKRQAQLLGGVAIVRDHVHQLRGGADLVAECGQPLRPIIGVGRKIALVKEHEDRFVGLGGQAEKPLYGRVVVFLLREHGQQNVGRLADGLRPRPVHLYVGIHVRSIQKQQARRHARTHAPIQHILIGIV